jgi:hypothetical protein
VAIAGTMRIEHSRLLLCVRSLESKWRADLLLELHQAVDR